MNDDRPIVFISHLDAITLRSSVTNMPDEFSREGLPKSLKRSREYLLVILQTTL